MKYTIVPGLLFTLMFGLAMISFANSSFASGCKLTSAPVINATVDVLATPPASISVPAISFTCLNDQAMTRANQEYCYRADPVGGQIRDNYSYYLLGPPNSRLSFHMIGADNADLSRNDNSLPTEGFDWSEGNGPVGTAKERNTDVWTVQIFPFSSQDNVQAGSYTGLLNFWIYQRDNDPANLINNCVNMPFTSKSMAGQLSFNITVVKNCLLENPVNIDFGQVSGVAATAQPTAQGSVGIRCTTGTPYNIAIDAGQNSPDGSTRQMKSADGKSFIPYQLCKDSSCTSIFTPTAPVSVGDGGLVNTAATVPIFAKLSKLAAAPASGIYTDTVVATVTF